MEVKLVGVSYKGEDGELAPTRFQGALYFVFSFNDAAGVAFHFSSILLLATLFNVFTQRTSIYNFLSKLAETGAESLR